MRYRRLFCFVLWFCLILPTAAGAARKVHDFAGRCEECHLTDPAAGGVRVFTRNINALCRECHRVAVTNAHPSDGAPRMELPQDFWLDGEGRLNCATCHDPHPGEEASPFLLRGGALGTDFCRLCHDRAVAATGEHLAVTFLAHSKPYTLPDKQTAEPDRISAGCLTCHGGSGKPHIHRCGWLKEKRCSEHILGVNYAAAAAARSDLRPVDDLSPAISLYEGKVGCTSCHSIYAHQKALLVFSNLEGGLCLECHWPKGGGDLNN